MSMHHGRPVRSRPTIVKGTTRMEPLPIDNVDMWTTIGQGILLHYNQAAHNSLSLELAA